MMRTVLAKGQVGVGAQTVEMAAFVLWKLGYLDFVGEVFILRRTSAFPSTGSFPKCLECPGLYWAGLGGTWQLNPGLPHGSREPVLCSIISASQGQTQALC